MKKRGILKTPYSPCEYCGKPSTIISDDGIAICHECNSEALEGHKTAGFSDFSSTRAIAEALADDEEDDNA